MAGTELDRRNFLVQGGLVAVGAASGGCAASSLTTGEPGARRGAKLERLEALLEGTSKFRYHEDYRELGPKTGHSLAMVRHHDTQLQEHLRTMLIAGAAHELGRDDPDLHSIIKRNADDIDASVLGSLAQVESMAEGNNDRLLQVLREQPRLPLDVCDIFEELSASVGTPLASRDRLRRAAKHLSWRLERQDPGLVMAEFATRSNRLLARAAAAGPPVLPDEPGAPPSQTTEAPPMPTPVNKSEWDQLDGAAPADGSLPSYDNAPPVVATAGSNMAMAPVEHFVGQWANVTIRNLGTDVYFVRGVTDYEVTLITTRARKRHATRVDVLGAGPPSWSTRRRAEAERARRGGAVMIGIGVPLIILGAALAPFTVGIGAIPITPGIGLLIAGIVYLTRVPRVE